MDANVWADLLDQREPGLCAVCGTISFPMRTWVQVPPTRGKLLYKLWLCNCGFRKTDLTLFKPERP